MARPFGSSESSVHHRPVGPSTVVRFRLKRFDRGGCGDLGFPMAEPISLSHNSMSLAGPTDIIVIDGRPLDS